MNIRTVCAILAMSLTVTACDISVGTFEGGIEDMDAPKAVEDLAPLASEQFEYAQTILRAFYSENTDALVAQVHASQSEALSASVISNIYKFKSDDVDTMEYYGHGFWEEDGLPFTVVQFKVPTDNGYDLVRVVLTSEPECCELAGLHSERKFIKTLFGD